MIIGLTYKTRRFTQLRFTTARKHFFLLDRVWLMERKNGLFIFDLFQMSCQKTDQKAIKPGCGFYIAFRSSRSSLSPEPTRMRPIPGWSLLNSLFKIRQEVLRKIVFMGPGSFRLLPVNRLITLTKNRFLRIPRHLAQGLLIPFPMTNCSQPSKSIASINKGATTGLRI